ncbi:MAG: PHB depolymerase family esterase, partial [Bacteroidota bacterium]
MHWNKITLFSALLSLMFGFGCNRDYTIDDREKIEFGGETRTYRLHVPENYNGTDSLPIVFVLHGGRGNSKKAVQFTNGRFNQLSDRDGFLVVYPDGLKKNWNDGRGVQEYYSHANNVDDVGFIAHLIDHFSAIYPVDQSRIYATGASNGGFMSSRLACDMEDRIAAIAPVIAGIPKNITQLCFLSRQIPVLMINGTEDKLVPWDGEFVRNLKEEDVLGEKLTVPETIDFWLDNLICISTPDSTYTLDEVPDDETSVTVRQYNTCHQNAEFWFYEIIGGGHTWP